MAYLIALVIAATALASCAGHVSDRSSEGFAASAGHA